MFVVITLSLSGVEDRGPKVFHKPDVFIRASLGDADLVSELRRRARPFDSDELIYATQPLKDLFLHKNKV
ncbi:MAG TPA: hypothetical protein VHD83_13320 [Puia sp.]|nr:hypothetical protein [Puia sp.]